MQVDQDQSHAQLVRDSPVPPSQDSCDEDEKGPLDHYIEPLDDILSSDPLDDSFCLLSDICSKIVVEGKDFLSIPEPSSSSASQNGERCKIPLQELTKYFSGVWQGGESYNSIYAQNAEGRVGVIEQDFSFAEVARALRSSENTASGPDRLPYHHWRSLDPSVKVLTRTFNVCLRNHRVPNAWKDSTTILLP
ncbi:reverse transcriptase domain-containing protein [Caerostris darwini]|uniref:Reverse transcriptase domain-containing protein n=1 Tax=Caerostris darwini TaxID=1538125 RepID=A0AAV4UX59_9ARAC|nr:reverse transcriptase domain-containing protein [Caerostris darwini]